MARVEECFCRLDVNFILTDPRWRFRQLLDKVLYLTIWATAVQIRREVLPKEYNSAHFAEVLRVPCSEVGRAMRRLRDGRASAPLISRDTTGAITVIGVKAKHKKLIWRDEGDIRGIPPQYRGDKSGRKRKRKRKREEEEQDARAREESDGEGVFSEELPGHNNPLIEFCTKTTARILSPTDRCFARSEALVDNYGAQWCLAQAREIVYRQQNFGKTIGHPNYILAALENLAAKKAIEDDPDSVTGYMRGLMDDYIARMDKEAEDAKSTESSI